MDLNAAQMFVSVVQAGSSGAAGSTGAASDSGEHGLSPTQAAIGLTPEVARGTVRLSLGWQTNESDVERAASLLAEAWEALR